MPKPMFGRVFSGTVYVGWGSALCEITHISAAEDDLTYRSKR